MRIAPSIELSVRQREILERLIRSPTAEQRLVAVQDITINSRATGSPYMTMWL